MYREQFFRNSFLLILGYCLHCSLLLTNNTKVSLFPSELFLQKSTDFWIQLFFLTSGSVFFLQFLIKNIHYKKTGKFSKNRGFIDLFFLSLYPAIFYLLILPEQFFSSVIGLLFCIVQGIYVVYSSVWFSSKRQSWSFQDNLWQRHELGGIVPERIYLSQIALLAYIIIFAALSLRPLANSTLQNFLFTLFTLLSFVNIFILISKQLNFIYNSAKKCNKHECRKGSYYCFVHLLPSSFWLFCLLILLTPICLVTENRLNTALIIMLLLQVSATSLISRAQKNQNVFLTFLLENPAQMLLAGFALLILLGAAIFTLPISSSDGQGFSIIDSLFTAASAVCVTGLTVIDVSTSLSFIGKAVLLMLVQLGGLGIMTLVTFIGLLIGRKFGIFGVEAMRQSTGEENTQQAKKILTIIVLGTFAIEGSGTILLSFFYYYKMGFCLSQSLRYGLFMSVNAFCNAGFSLHQGSLSQFANEAFPLMIISILIIIGGLGFSLLSNVCRKLLSKKKFPLAPYESTVLSCTVLLCIGGALLFLFFEKNGVLDGLDFSERAYNAWFQSVTARTAGFNSLDLSAMQNSSKVLMMVLMFVGGASASTAGGIKVGTFALLLLTVFSWLKGENTLVIRKKSFAASTVQQAATIFFITVAIAVVGVMFLSIILPQAKLDEIIFEVISAIGTVGLSSGLTGQLNNTAKCLLIILMFIGKVGPISFLLILRPVKKKNIHYPEGRFLIG